ncbi:MAG TPA: leucyl aminopeptidase [Longimicrobiaceae bacterium]|nr:leucyl aminopeptidase [Longimicrobiaceae bacterium]
MDVTVAKTDCTEFKAPLLAVKIFQDEPELIGPVAKLDDKMGGAISEVIRRGDFAGREGQTSLLYPASGAIAAERVLLVGLGPRSDLDLEKLRRAAGTAVKEAMKLRVGGLASLLHHAELVADRISPEAAGRAVAEGAVLAAYTFREMKSGPGEGEPPIVELSDFVVLEKKEQKAAEIEKGVRTGSIIARAENRARDLGNLPGNVATPSYLAETAERIAKQHGMKCTVLGRKELEKEGLETLLTVSRGSDQEPKLIVIEHQGGKKGDKPLVLLGKGLTFDAGGISIKPANGMEDMKFDMSGGAAVIGAMQGIGELDVAANVVGIIPSSENLLSGSAMKPGDIIRSHLGKTIEVVNTDAEGRLILADALSYLRRFEPAAVVDAATLTGACVVALGHQVTALLGNNDGLLNEVRAAGERSGEKVWPLPMPADYKDLLKSDYADIKNSGGRAAGTITAAWFLREFVGDFPWAHLDVAGTAYGDGKLSYQAKGSTGVPTRIFVEWVLARAGM